MQCGGGGGEVSGGKHVGEVVLYSQVSSRSL